MNIYHKSLLVFTIISLSFVSLLAQTRTTYSPLKVGEHWSRRVVTEENNSRRFYYRPVRFEYLEMNTENVKNLQIRSMLTKEAKELVIFVKINNTEKKHTLKINKSDNRYFYTENLNLEIPTGTNSIFIKTRNPDAYFRHYRITKKTMKPKVYSLTPQSYHKKYILKSKTSNSEYYSANESKVLTYKADADGSVYFFVRSIRKERTGATVDIFVNSNLNQTVILPNKTSKDYSLDNEKVSTGTRIEIKDLKKGDTITITPKTNHEIISRLFITTNELF